jgi:hypothetical protein
MLVTFRRRLVCRESDVLETGREVEQDGWVSPYVKEGIGVIGRTHRDSPTLRAVEVHHLSPHQRPRVRVPLLDVHERVP